MSLSVAKADVKESPHVGRSDERLTGSEEGQLREHYGTAANDTAAAGASGNGTAGAGQATGTAGRDRAAADDDAMVRHEERLRVGTESEETGRVALRKYVVTEDQTVTVPVSHEEVRVEREPIDGDDAKGRPGALGEETQETTLHAERPVVDKTTEAVEKVRMDTRTVTEDEQVSDTVRKEEIDVDDPQNALRRDRDDRS